MQFFHRYFPFKFGLRGFNLTPIPSNKNHNNNKKHEMNQKLGQILKSCEQILQKKHQTSSPIIENKECVINISIWCV